MKKVTLCKNCGSAITQPSSGRRMYCTDRICRAQVTAKREQGYNADGRKKRRNLKHRFGISVEEYDAMMIKCGGVCEACGGLPDPNGKISSQRYLHVDHDHTSGKVRGILCHSCNLSLGLAKEDPSRLLGLLEYLRTHTASNSEAVSTTKDET